MGYLEDKEAEARALVGKRIEIPVYFDTWMRGARFGVVKSLWWRDGVCEGIRVKMDHPSIKRLIRIARIDLVDVRVLD